MKQRIENIKKKNYFKQYSLSLALFAGLVYIALVVLFAPVHKTETKDDFGAKAVEQPYTIEAGDRGVICKLPSNWEIGTADYPEKEIPLPPGEFDTTMALYQDGEVIGYVGLADFEPYTEEIPRGEYHKTVWPGMRLSSMCIWDPFFRVSTSEKGESGTVKISYVDYRRLSDTSGTSAAAMPHFETDGILAYNKDAGVYAGFAFLPASVSTETLENIAQSVTLYKAIQ